MLYVVLVLVLIAAGLVVAGLITANTLWAWISVGVSVLAGIVMLAEWLRRRKRAAAEPETAAAAASTSASADEAADADKADPADSAVEGEVTGELPVEDEKEPATALIPAEGDLAESSADKDEDTAGAAEPDEPAAESGDPGEEDTDAADLLVVSGLDVEVLVVDEYPRYHLAACTWLVDRDTIPIAVAEARDLGFTPCDRCRPDAHLAATHRDSRKKANK
ncbi:hypothetical protein [Amycolatopsis albispora]|uniref:Uncharacterized protein n=1 Tax=Amycolatopsis albispora TaxID=1804986 RepID=A0A344L799_9PSEU|nr:hypothetical protein [Amycolatopsis albispora]AXB43923.1 hypothetical protein A4R43_16480 [Amycolatopsis albispora]